jgi:hypothetical protein
LLSKVLSLKLPYFVQQEVDQIRAQLSPEKLSVDNLSSQQAAYNKKAVLVQGSVFSVVSLDEMDEQTVSTWFLNLPTTVETTASATYFYLQSEMGTQILVKYPADLDVSAKDQISATGFFSAYGITVQTKGLLRSKQEEIVNPLGEPFIGAILIENLTKQKIEYVRINRD